MSNIQDIRDQLRAGASSKPGFFRVGLRTMATIAVCAAISGVIYSSFFREAVAPLQPSASIPTFHRVDPNGTPQQSPLAPQPSESRVETAPHDATRYAGLSPRQIGKVADEVCFARAHARFPHWSKTPRLTTKELHDFDVSEMPHFNELMHCLVTEAPARYCSSSQRRMIAAELAMYFRGIAYGNKVLAKFREELVAEPGPGKLQREFGLDPAYVNKVNQMELVADPRVVAGIEKRLADGTLTKADRDAFIAAAPEPLRRRFANVTPSTPACPAQPWWAFWHDL